MIIKERIFHWKDHISRWTLIGKERIFHLMEDVSRWKSIGKERIFYLMEDVSRWKSIGKERIFYLMEGVSKWKSQGKKRIFLWKIHTIVFTENIIASYKKLKLFPRNLAVTQKGIPFEGNIKQLSYKLEGKNYIVEERNSPLTLRPAKSMTVVSWGISLYIRKIKLIFREESLFIKFKLNYYTFFIGLISLIFFIEEWIILNYISFLILIVIISFFYFFMVWITTLSMKKKVSRDIRDSIPKKLW